MYKCAALWCRDDRLAWVSALAGQKLQIAGKGPAYNDQSTALVKRLGIASNGQAPFPLTNAAKLLEDLKKKDAMADPSCQRILTALQKQIRDADAMMQEKNHQIQHLMDERRQLQTELVTESQRLENLVRCNVRACCSASKFTMCLHFLLVCILHSHCECQLPCLHCLAV
jgi:hypothetical protein